MGWRHSAVGVGAKVFPARAAGIKGDMRKNAGGTCLGAPGGRFEVSEVFTPGLPQLNRLRR